MFEKSTWEQFFDIHASIYEENIFTKNTLSKDGATPAFPYCWLICA